MFDVPDMSSPSHVAPGVSATFDTNRRTRPNDGLAGSRSQAQVRGRMAAPAGRAENTKPTTEALAKTAIRNRMRVVP